MVKVELICTILQLGSLIYNNATSFYELIMFSLQNVDMFVK